MSICKLDEGDKMFWLQKQTNDLHEILMILKPI